MARTPPQFKKFTESKDKAADRRVGIKEGTKKDTALDRKRGLPPDKKARPFGAGHMANARNPLGAGNAGKKMKNGKAC